jgi:hypothetical protein
MRELLAGDCSADELVANYETAKAITASAIAAEAIDRPGIRGHFDVAETGEHEEAAERKRNGRKKRRRPVDLAQFFRARELSVLDQLAGRSQGVRPARGRGPAGRTTGKEK